MRETSMSQVAVQRESMRLHVNAKVNGQEVRITIDTGGSNLYICSDLQ